jgi:hypothetical protein
MNPDIIFVLALATALISIGPMLGVWFGKFQTVTWGVVSFYALSVSLWVWWVVVR